MESHWNEKRMPKEKVLSPACPGKEAFHDHAVMESFFGHLKSEAVYLQKITKVSNTIVRKIVLEYIHYYTCVRIQEQLNHLSPKEFRG
ncbi:Transposase [Bacillus thuringiensis serovar andalousiensis BGSC 4AW1]|nr:Transposase [Bacillus thuringiensis serovar andalousiensis BGSC 4AW1]